ncbi:MAG: FAD binding domain-containing protein [Treponema sp.]|jgi:CO/xanthine dehydrogenase FAD-binding subunit|nr:FAD binding domain-containing protein [Treponema sp.]
MAGQPNQVFFPGSLGELFNAWTRFPDGVPFAGGTELIRGQRRANLSLPKNILALSEIEELSRMSRTERYLEIGAMVKLRDIMRLGKIVPEALTSSLEGIAGPQLRGLATIGGNICGAGRRLDCSAPLIALDAVYELRNAQSGRWISAARFSQGSVPGSALGKQELLTRVRIPLDQWDFSAYRKFGDRDSGAEGGVLIFIMKNRKNILTGLRVVFAGECVLRDQNSEASLTGKRLPLSHRDAQDFLGYWRETLADRERPSPLIRSEILGYIESLIYNLAD